jgi:hypothetical protein
MGDDIMKKDKEEIELEKWLETCNYKLPDSLRQQQV